MGIIRLLDQQLINLIAAGEVVERPASVVKELLENSLDANADKIIVKVNNAGLDLIEVSDNGVGMSRDDALLSLKQHATSKISTVKDLESIHSFGFRGEALASISSMAEKTVIATKTQKEDGLSIEYYDSKVTDGKERPIQTGTTISIYNLFQNVPARKKFLKSNSTELKHITQTFLTSTLLHIDKHFELIVDGKSTYKLTTTNSLKERLFEAFGKNFSNSVIISDKIEGKIKLQMVLSDPLNTKKTSSIQYTYINGRYVNDKVTSAAILQAYKGFIHKDLKPNFIVDIHMDPREVDVNVHPRKLEVKFENSQEIFSTVYMAAKSLIEGKNKESFAKNFQTRNEKQLSTAIPTTQNYDRVQNFNSFLKESEYSYNKPQKKNVKQSIAFTQKLFENNSPIGSTDDNSKPENSNVFQIFNTYIIYQKEDTIILIDQHAAAEKILFEKLINQNQSIKTKQLLVPHTVELSNHEKAILLEQKDILLEVGLVIDDYLNNSLQVTEIPEIIDNLDIEDTIREFLEPPIDFVKTFEKFVENSDPISKTIYDKIATLACHGSIRAGQKLSEIEMVQIISNLQKLDMPFNCPHGRPIYWELSKYEIEKNFKRVI